MGNGIVYIDKVGLEEIITYRDAEFEFIDGYYYDQGRNITYNQSGYWRFIQFQKRLKTKNPAQMCIQLLMNSMYCKTIIKPVETDTIVKDNRYYFEKYISYNYNYIDSVIEVNSKSLY